MLNKIPKRLLANSCSNIPEHLRTIYYSGGDLPKPETNPQHIRLYGHNLCPFAERAELSLRAKQIDFQFCMLDFAFKAQWHMDFNGGTVPILEAPDGTLLKDSQVIAQFACDFAGPD